MKKGIKITLIIITSLILLGIIFAFTDYSRLKNGKKPIFIYRNVNIYNNTIFLGTEYYGLGYSITDCKNCLEPNKISVNPFYLSSYAWFIETSNISNIEVVKSEKCDSKAKLYSKLDNNRNLYTYCIDEIKIIEENDNLADLKDYLKIYDDAIYHLIENYTNQSKASYDDGGTKIYSGDDFNILVCHTISGNNDVYIGIKEMGYNKEFCK